MNELGIMIVVSKETDFIKKFQEAQEIGVESCQLSFWEPALYTDEMAERIRFAVAETKFKVSLLWAGWTGPKHWDFVDGPTSLGLVPIEYRKVRIEELKRASDFAVKIGVQDIATHVGFLPENPTDPTYESIIVDLREMCSYFKKRGQNFLFETGQETPITLLRTIEKIGLENVFINFDTANLILYGKANPVDALRVFGKYVRNTHIKDGKYPTNGMELGVETKVGDGLVDFLQILKMLKELGYEGVLTIEREITGEEQKQDIRDTVIYLRSLLGELT